MNQLDLYVMRGCNACEAAKLFLTKKGLSYKEIYVTRVDQLPRGSDGTTPQLVFKGQLVGGVRRMTEWLKNTPDRVPVVQRQQPRQPRPDASTAAIDTAFVGGGERVPTEYVEETENSACGFDSCFSTI